jgi:hypothetical protein
VGGGRAAILGRLLVVALAVFMGLYMNALVAVLWSLAPLGTALLYWAIGASAAAVIYLRAGGRWWVALPMGLVMAWVPVMVSHLVGPPEQE